ncbi:RNA polymerase sigma factor [Limnoglobus roseus]|uniref:TIGR03067 domain-containing protein n=1 Tax=Limnoglobus roseus TaxID=2598579 RepID=A0A5C1AJ03_9BACT|nr:RNA polymerase sigma factor [Limnoglobus roseus]QEL17672.1 TIGR03067 domain-containing protein [Limnoglobus roseus]
MLEAFVATRDEAAFAELVRRHGPKVYAVCRRILGRHDLAEDAYQAVFVVLARKAHTIRPRAAVGGFLYGVARNAAVRALTVSRRRKETLAGTVPDTAAAERAVVEPDALVMLDEEIANLSDANRAAVVLCEIDGLSRAAAARQLGIPEGTLSYRLAAARKQLAARLAKRGVTLSAAFFTALAEAARSAPPVELAAISPAVSAIAAGVMRIMILAKIRSAAAVGVVAVTLVAWSLTAVPVPKVAAAPPPKPRPAPDPGLIWVWRIAGEKAAVLTGYTPDGRKAHEVKIPDRDRYLGLTPDGQKIAFKGKGGKLADSPDAPGLTVHLRDISEGADGTDTGVPAGQGVSWPVWSPDMAEVVYGRSTRTPDPDGGTSYQYARRVVATGAETMLRVPADYEVAEWAPDGAWLLVSNGRSRTEWGRYTLADGKFKTLVGNCLFHTMDVASGTPVIGYGGLAFPGDLGKPSNWGMFTVDPSTSQAIKLERFEMTAGMFAVDARWAPDGKRVACAIREGRNGEKETARLIVCEPDGGKPVQIASWPHQLLAFVHWLPSKRPAAARLPTKGDPH